MPAITLASRIPKSSPEKTTEIADARRESGARSAASGMRIWGVTVTTPMRKERTSNMMRLFVIASPIVSEVEVRTRMRMSCRRRTRSPRGDMRSSPAAYLEIARVLSC